MTDQATCPRFRSSHPKGRSEAEDSEQAGGVDGRERAVCSDSCGRADSRNHGLVSPSTRVTDYTRPPLPRPSDAGLVHREGRAADRGSRRGARSQATR